MMEGIYLILALCAFPMGAAVLYVGYRLGRKERTGPEIIELREADSAAPMEKAGKKKTMTDEEEKEDNSDDKPSIEEQWNNVFEYEGPRKGKKEA